MMDNSRLFNVGSSFLGLYFVVMLFVFDQLGVWVQLTSQELGSVIAVTGLIVVLSSEIMNQILMWIFIYCWGGYESLGIQGELLKGQKAKRKLIANSYNRLIRQRSDMSSAVTSNNNLDLNSSIEVVRRHQHSLMIRRFLQSSIILSIIVNLVLFLVSSISHLNSSALSALMMSLVVLALLYFLIRDLFNRSNTELLEFERVWIGVALNDLVQTESNA